MVTWHNLQGIGNHVTWHGFQGGNLWHGFNDKRKWRNFWSMTNYLDGIRHYPRIKVKVKSLKSFYFMKFHFSRLWEWNWGTLRAVLLHLRYTSAQFRSETALPTPLWYDCYATAFVCPSKARPAPLWCLGYSLWALGWVGQNTKQQGCWVLYGEGKWLQDWGSTSPSVADIASL